MWRTLLKYKVAWGILAILLIGGGYYGYKRVSGGQEETRYVLAEVKKGTIVSSVSGSGQVSVSSQVEVKAKAAGEVAVVGVKNGQEVKAGALLVQLDMRDAQKAVRDAQANLDAAQLSLTKLKQPADELARLQAEHAVSQAKESKQNAQDNLKKAYEDGFNTVANAFLDLPTIMTGLDDLLFDSTLEQSQMNIDWYANRVSTWEQDKATRYRADVAKSYTDARKTYTTNFDHYKLASRTSEAGVLEALILETHETMKRIADTVKMVSNYIDFVKDTLEQHQVTIPALVTAHQTTLSAYTGKTNGHLLALLSIKQSIDDAKEDGVNADRTIAEKTEALAKLKAGAEALDIQAQELTVTQKQNALLDAKEKLADYVLYAPFDGIVAKIDLKKGDTVSASTVAATFITRQRMAEITLNEVDVAKVHAGQKATLTFDAVSDLLIGGEVLEIDTIGTISQGVVSYIVKITFDTQDERVRPGMSASADIIIEKKEQAFIVPNMAVKSRGEMHFVEVQNGEAALRRVPVTVGIANDEFTEIVSGLSEGDKIVARTVNGPAAPAANREQAQGFRLPGLPGGSGGRR